MRYDIISKVKYKSYRVVSSNNPTGSTVTYFICSYSIIIASCTSWRKARREYQKMVRAEWLKTGVNDIQKDLYIKRVKTRFCPASPDYQFLM